MMTFRPRRTAQTLLSLLFGLQFTFVPILAQGGDYSPCNNPYSVDGTLTEAEAADLYHLLWPQERESITDRFGYPMYFDEIKDFYAIEGRVTTWIVVFYNGASATGAEYIDRNC